MKVIVPDIFLCFCYFLLVFVIFSYFFSSYGGLSTPQMHMYFFLGAGVVATGRLPDTDEQGSTIYHLP